jgi:hypothetical protein
MQRPARPEEARAAKALASEHGLFALCRMLLNASEFIYID